MIFQINWKVSTTFKKEEISIIMATGTIKWFDSKKGYGFIAPDDGQKDVFIHISAVESAGLSHLNDGQKISYEIEENKGRESAIDISLVDAA